MNNSNFISDFLQYCAVERRYSHATVDTYKYVLSSFEKWLKENGDLKINTVTVDSARSYIRSLNKSKIKAVSVNGYRTVLKVFYNHLVKNGFIGINPFTNTVRTTQDIPKPSALSLTDIIKLLDTVNDLGTFALRDCVMFELFWNSGIRTSELTNLNLDDIDFELDKENESICILNIREGKGGKSRVVPIPSSSTYLLNTYLSGRQVLYPTSDWVFPNRHGRRLHRSQVYLVMKDFLSLTSSTKKGAHVLRHTYATLMLNHGANILAVQDLLGHSSPETTQLYATPNKDLLMDVYMKSHPKANTDIGVSNRQDGAVHEIINYKQDNKGKINKKQRG